MSSLEIRRYTPADQAAVWALNELTLRAAGTYAGHGPWDEDLLHIEERYLQSGGEFLVGFLGGRLTAMGALKRTTAERAEVKRMRVHPDFQRRGFGSEILRRLEARAQELGYTLLHLDTPIENPAPEAFYRKHGYRGAGQQKVGRFTLVLYVKRLRPEAPAPNASDAGLAPPPSSAGAGEAQRP